MGNRLSARQILSILFIPVNSRRAFPCLGYLRQRVISFHVSALSRFRVARISAGIGSLVVGSRWHVAE
jgi:hypothetical protein